MPDAVDYNPKTIKELYALVRQIGQVTVMAVLVSHARLYADDLTHARDIAQAAIDCMDGEQELFNLGNIMQIMELIEMSDDDIIDVSECAVCEGGLDDCEDEED